MSWSKYGEFLAFAVVLIIKVQPLFEAIKWAGVAYLVYLGAQAIRSAIRGQYSPLDSDENPPRRAWPAGGSSPACTAPGAC